MAVTSSGDGNFSSVIAGGLSVNDDVIIDHDVTMDGHAPNVNSLVINSGKTLTGGGYKITLDGENGSGFVITNDGSISGNLDLEINTNGTTSLNIGGSAGNCFRDLKINTATTVLHLHTNTFIDGQLTIAAGELRTFTEGNSQRSLTCDGSDISVSSGAQLTINDSQISSRKLTSSGTLSGTGGNFTVTGAGLGDTTRTIDLGGTVTGDVDITLTGAGNNRHEDLQAATGNIRNLTINNAAAVIHTGRDTTIDGDLTITAGTLSTDDSGTSVDLTVGGGIKNTGTLTANASTIIITGEISGFAFDQMGTFNAGTSTVQIGDGSTSTVGSSTHFKSNNCHNLIINQHQDAPNGNVAWRAYTGTEVTIGGNLTVTRGRFYRNTSTQDLTVTGDVDIASVGQVGTSAASGSNTFGGIRINSGGTYLATSGTTTVTNRFTGTSNLWKNDGGTFTHNNGTVKFTDNDHSKVKEQGSFYNFEQESSLGDYALVWETAGGGSCTILNNLTITRGDFEIDAAGDTLDIYGQTIINGSSNSGARFNNDKNQTGTITHHGLVTIIQGTYHVEDGATVNMAGIRNVGGLVD